MKAAMYDDFESGEEEIDARGTVTLNGILYPPRGAHLELQNQGTGSTGLLNSNIQIVTGTLEIENKINATLGLPTHPLKRAVVTLIE
jgi:hypothetical protein